VWPELLIKDFKKKNQKQHERIKKLYFQKKYLTVNEKHMGKLMVVTRIRDHSGITQQIQKLLSQLGLYKNCITVFLRYTKKTAHMLKILEPFVTYGLPSEQTVRDIVTKRAFVLNSEKNKVALDNNVVVENTLGHLNIVCIEDIIHEIYHNGPNFAKVSEFLLPFSLKPRGFKNTRVPFKKGGECGWRGKKINDLLETLI